MSQEINQPLGLILCNEKQIPLLFKPFWIGFSISYSPEHPKWYNTSLQEQEKGSTPLTTS